MTLLGLERVFGLVQFCAAMTNFSFLSTLHFGSAGFAFDTRADKGRGAVVPRRVTRLYRNSTTERIGLRWFDGTAREGVTAPGRHVPNALGGFPTTPERARTGSKTVVSASGALRHVMAERSPFFADVAPQVERAQAVGMIAGNAALKPADIDVWQSYNFEVDDLHTYVAGGERAHNSSGVLGQVGNTIDDALDRILVGTDDDGSARDKISDALTALLHVAGELLSRVAVRKLDRGVAPKYLAWKSWSNSAAAVFLGAAIAVTPAHAETGKYFEKWTKSEGFDVGYACNWWKDVPGPESMFQVRKLKSAETLADIDSAEFRMIKPYSVKRTFDNHNGSLFTVRVDREASSVSAIRVVYSFSKNGSCSYLLKASDNSSIEVLRGSGAPSVKSSGKAVRWIERTIADCHRRLRRAIDPNLLFDCVAPLNPNSDEARPTEGLDISVMPEGIVPASVARIYLRKHGDVFAITIFGESVEVLKIGEQE